MLANTLKTHLHFQIICMRFFLTCVIILRLWSWKVAPCCCICGFYFEEPQPLWLSPFWLKLVQVGRSHCEEQLYFNPLKLAPVGPLRELECREAGLMVRWAPWLAVTVVPWSENSRSQAVNRSFQLAPCRSIGTIANMWLFGAKACPPHLQHITYLNFQNQLAQV